MNKPLAISLLFAYFEASCASYTPQTATLLRLQYAAVSDEKQGLAVGVTPHLDTERNKEVFGADLKQVGILPLQLVVRNNGQKPLVIRKNDFVLRLSGGDEYAPAPAESVVKRLESNANVIGWTVAFGLAGFLLASSEQHQQQEADKNQRADFRIKEFEDANLGFQESARGFLFYLAPDDLKELKDAKLFVKALDASTGERIEMTLSLPDMVELNVREGSDER